MGRSQGKKRGRSGRAIIKVFYCDYHYGHKGLILLELPEKYTEHLLESPAGSLESRAFMYQLPLLVVGNDVTFHGC